MNLSCVSAEITIREVSQSPVEVHSFLDGIVRYGCKLFSWSAFFFSSMLWLSCCLLKYSKNAFSNLPVRLSVVSHCTTTNTTRHSLLLDQSSTSRDWKKRPFIKRPPQARKYWGKLDGPCQAKMTKSTQVYKSSKRPFHCYGTSTKCIFSPEKIVATRLKAF